MRGMGEKDSILDRIKKIKRNFRNSSSVRNVLPSVKRTSQNPLLYHVDRQSVLLGQF
jgi:hypothetical protein